MQRKEVAAVASNLLNSSYVLHASSYFILTTSEVGTSLPHEETEAQKSIQGHRGSGGVRICTQV